MSRFLAVHLPAYRFEFCGFDSGQIAVLTEWIHQVRRVVDVTPAARTLGLRSGMNATEARALVPDVIVIDRAQDDERRNLDSLLSMFRSLSDRVAFPWTDQIILDVSHTSHLFGGEAGVLSEAMELAASLGHQACAIVADDPLAAAVLSSFSEACRVVVSGDTAATLAPLPLASLPLDANTLESLTHLGLERVGQWAVLDPASVADRYGAWAATTHRVARGETATAHHIAWKSFVDPHPSVSAVIGGASTMSELRMVIPGLLAELTDRLRACDRSAVRLHVVFQLETADCAPKTERFDVRVGRPTQSAARFEHLIWDRMARITLDAPISDMRIEALQTAKGIGWQVGLMGRREASEACLDVLARLQDVLGPQAVFSASLHDDWKPERSWFPSSCLPAAADRASSPSDDVVDRMESFERDEPMPRPTLLGEPRPLRVQHDQGRPVRWTFEGQEQRLHDVIGPERIQGHWWHPEQAYNRTYWCVRAGEQSAWIFNDGVRWFHHGWFD